MTYRQITLEERYAIALLRREGWPPAAFARVLGRHRSTIGREPRRNATHHDGWYRSRLADWYARKQRRQRHGAHDRRSRCEMPEDVTAEAFSAREREPSFYQGLRGPSRRSALQGA